MSLHGASSNLKILAEDLIEACEEHSVTISPLLAEFTVQQVFRDSRLGFRVEAELQDVDQFVELCKDKLVYDRGPLMETIRMQALMASTRITEKDILILHHRNVDHRLKSILRKITDFSARTQNDVQYVRSQVIHYLILKSGLGDPASDKVIRATESVLFRIVTQKEFSDFLNLSRFDKMIKLREWTPLMIGVRVYDFKCGFTKAGMKNLPDILAKAIQKTCIKLDCFREVASKRQRRLKRALVHLLFEQDHTSRDDEKKAECLKQAQLNLWQFVLCTEPIRTEVARIRRKCHRLDQQIGQVLAKFQTGLSNNLAMQSIDMTPGILELAELWRFFQDEAIVISHLNSLLDTLQEFTLCTRRLSVPETDSDFCENDSEEALVGNSEIALELQRDLKPYTEGKDLEFKGFCPVALVTGNGLLLEGKQSIGLYHAGNGANFVFSNAQRAVEFLKNPDVFIRVVNEILAENPSLSRLLGTPQVNLTHHDIRSGLSEKSSQTDDRDVIVASGAQKDYEWNEWNMRREALRLVHKTSPPVNDKSKSKAKIKVDRVS